METEYFKSTSRLLDRDYVNRRVLDLSEEVLLVSASQKVAELTAIKVRSLKENSAARPGAGELGSNWAVFFSDL